MAVYNMMLCGPQLLVTAYSYTILEESSRFNHHDSFSK